MDNDVDKSKPETLLEKYALPRWLRVHSAVVRDVARQLAEALAARGEELRVGPVIAAALLHDIGKSALVADGGRDHADLSALVLAAEGWIELAEMARRHPVYAIRDPARAPRSLEERIVYYADRRGGLTVLSVEERLREQAERFPDVSAEIMACLEPVKSLERDLFAKLSLRPEDLCAGR